VAPELVTLAVVNGPPLRDWVTVYDAAPGTAAQLRVAVVDVVPVTEKLPGAGSEVVAIAVVDWAP
jgi:hypothetical protein